MLHLTMWLVKQQHLLFTTQKMRDTVSSQATKLSVTICKCGINKGGLDILARKSCNSSPFYAARCKCFKSGQPCTITCHFYNCGNPNGPRPIPTRIKKRVNRKHELQIDIPNRKQFASDRNETSEKGVGQILRVSFLMKLVGLHIWNVGKHYQII